MLESEGEKTHRKTPRRSESGLESFFFPGGLGRILCFSVLWGSSVSPNLGLVSLRKGTVTGSQLHSSMFTTSLEHV